MLLQPSSAVDQPWVTVGWFPLHLPILLMMEEESQSVFKGVSITCGFSCNPLTELLSPKLSRANGTLAPILIIIEKGDATEFLTLPFAIIPFALLNGERAPG